MKKKKAENNNPYNLLMYVEDNTQKIKRFETTKAMGKFIDNFNKKHPDYASMDSNYWVDFCIVGVIGDVHFFTDGIEVE